MKLTRIFLAMVMLLAVAGVAYVSQGTDTPATQMADAANKLLASLTPEQKKKAQLDFDSANRTDWQFIPLQNPDKTPKRKGLSLQEMNAEQKKLALALVAAGLSNDGTKKAVTIMSLEAILKEQEKNGANVRDPEWYFVTIFGTPGKTGQWGWRIEGHHLSVNFTLADNAVVSATPTFFGANPSTVKDGPKKGERILPEAEDYARELFKSLTDEQRKTALAEKQFGEPKAGSAKSGVGAPKGVAATKLTDKQREVLMKLVRSYADRLRPEVAAAELKALEAAGTDKIHFAYWGGTEPGQGYTYRVQGPSFVIEFLNVQADSAGNAANHIHSCWRKPDGDFGLTK